MLEELPHLILCAPGPLPVGLAVRAWLRRCQGELACQACTRARGQEAGRK
jgi:hypothetical protein